MAKSFNSCDLVLLEHFDYLVFEAFILNHGYLLFQGRSHILSFDALIYQRHQHYQLLLILLPVLVVNAKHVDLVFHHHLHVFALLEFSLDLLNPGIFHGRVCASVVVAGLTQVHVPLLRVLDGKDRLLQLLFNLELLVGQLSETRAFGINRMEFVIRQ